MPPINYLTSIRGIPATIEEVSRITSSIVNRKEEVNIKFKQGSSGREVATRIPIIRLLGLNTNMREATFTKDKNTFAEKNIRIHDLAEIGFTSITNSNNKDKVQCVACLGILSDFDKDDVPSTEHRLYYKNCPMLSGKIPGELHLLPQFATSTDSTPDKPSIANPFIKRLMNPGRQPESTPPHTENHNAEGDRYSMHAIKYNNPTIDTPLTATRKRSRTPSPPIDTEIRKYIKPSLEEEHGKDAKNFLQTSRMDIMQSLETSHVLGYIDELFAGNAGLPCTNKYAITSCMTSQLTKKCKEGREEAIRGILNLCAYRPTAALALSFFLIKDKSITTEDFKYPEWLQELAKKFKR